jgi:hypothetical protein
MLFGDPSQTIALPQYRVNVDKINDFDIQENQLDTLGALGRMRLAGHISDFTDQKISTFNGNIFLTVFDKPSELKTLDNDSKGLTFSFKSRKNVLYKGSATVKDGEFVMDFILPKDINFAFGQGHLSLYATDNVSMDAGGYYNNIVIGGTSEGGIVDNEGPEIDIFFDTRSFVYGGNTGNNPLLIIDLNDENGINLSSTSIGHDIVATLDDNVNNAIVLNNFYTPTVDILGSGTVEYQLNDLEPGLHKLHIKAWDILNNSSEAISEFLVVENAAGFIDHVKNYPNPFYGQTQFSFEHDLINKNLEIQINIYSISGRLVKTLENQKFSAGSKIDDIFWDGTDEIGGKLERGLYFYKIKISSQEFKLSRESDFQKLVILN